MGNSVKTVQMVSMEMPQMVVLAIVSECNVT